MPCSLRGACSAHPSRGTDRPAPVGPPTIICDQFQLVARPLEAQRNAWRPWVVVAPSPAIVLAVLYVAYRWIDPLPPRHLAIAAGPVASGYDNFARQYARILARDGVVLDIRNSAGAVEDLDLLREASSGVQAGLTTFGVTQPTDAGIFYSLGGIFDAVIFLFTGAPSPLPNSAIPRQAAFHWHAGNRLAIALSQVLNAIDAFDASTRLVDLENAGAIEALIAGEIDLAIFPSELDGSLLRRALSISGIRLMNVAQAEAIAKAVPRLKHVVLLISA
jgi:uncharacterized protein